jgi:ankyrin repeat protein
MIQNGETTLALASLYGHGDTVKYLVDIGADTKAKDCVSSISISYVHTRGSRREYTE